MTELRDLNGREERGGETLFKWVKLREERRLIFFLREQGEIEVKLSDLNE